MKQFSVRYRKEFLTGLKNTEFEHTNSMRKVTLTDICIEKDNMQSFDLERYQAVDGVFDPTNIFKHGIAYDGKFPQVFVGKEITILNYYGVLFKLDEDNDTLINLPVNRYDNSNERYTFIDNGNDWWLVNESMTVHCNDGTLTSYNVGVNTGLFVNGRIVMGGFPSFGIVPSIYSTLKNASANTIVWSPVGGTYMSTQFEETIADTTYLDSLDIGYSSVKGDVLSMVAYQEGFLVGTTKAIYYCKFIVAEISTLSITKVTDVGILNRNSLVDVNGVIYFVGKNHSLYKFGQGLTDLDYSYLLSAMTDLFLLSDDNNSTLFICDGSLGYMYKNEHLSELSKSISGLINY